MSILSYSLDGIADHGDLWQQANNLSSCKEKFPVRIKREVNGRQEVLNEQTNWLVFLMTSIRIEEITKDNYEEVFVRCRMTELAGAHLFQDGDVWCVPSLSLSDVRRHIGLRAKSGTEKLSFEDNLIFLLRTSAQKMLTEEQSRK